MEFVRNLLDGDRRTAQKLPRRFDFASDQVLDRSFSVFAFEDADCLSARPRYLCRHFIEGGSRGEDLGVEPVAQFLRFGVFPVTVIGGAQVGGHGGNDRHQELGSDTAVRLLRMEPELVQCLLEKLRSGKARDMDDSLELEEPEELRHQRTGEVDPMFDPWRLRA